MPGAEPTATDVVFDVEGTSLPADPAWPLLLAIEAYLPWLQLDSGAGIHPLRASPTGYGVVLLARRAKLILRVPLPRLADSLRLQDAALDVGGSPLKVGLAEARPLRPSATLAAQRVASDADDVAGFEAEVRDWLAQRNVAARCIAGRRRWAGAGAREIAGFALALHGLSPADSLRIQSEGLGGGRPFGWGLFVPAKAILAADE